MLQQTQVKTVVPYFKKFIEKYPNLDALLKASEDEILAQWSGLGFYRRAKNIYKACRVISEDFNNKLPSNINDLESLPGIGRSTAGAIMSIAFNEGHPILDANVKRVLERYKKISFKTENEKQKKLWLISEKLTPHKESYEYTQGIMDLGATHCSKSNPNCGVCPVSNDCYSAFEEVTNKVSLRKATPKPTVKLNFILPYTKNEILMHKKQASEYWESLWIPIDGNEVKIKGDQKYSKIRVNHPLSHLNLDMKIKAFEIDKKYDLETNLEYKWIKKSKVNEYAMPTPIKKVVSTL
jgi:A/G-specific adenine glycosylase